VISDSPAETEVMLRPARPEDTTFLFSVYASTRRPELAPLGWDDEAAQAFLRAQFEHEDYDWHNHLPGAECMVVMRGRLPVGRLYVARSAHEIRVLDLTLLPEHRRQGIGTMLLTTLLDEARATRRTVRLHVDRSNGLAELCRSMGFLPAATRAGAWLMEWTAEVTR
jgi:ribosomal protein S18 acetylase RimI-like enzyme